MLFAGGLQVSPIFFGILSALSLIASVLASVSGTGGGSLFIPIFSLAFPNDVHRAVPLAKVAVFGVALGACIVNFSGIRGLKKTSHYINYELATLIQPATLLGCLFGVFLNLLLPSIAIVGALICILTFVAYKTFNAGLQQRREVHIIEESPSQQGRRTNDIYDRETPSTGAEDELAENNLQLPKMANAHTEFQSPPISTYNSHNQNHLYSATRITDNDDLDSHHHSMERSPTGNRFDYGEIPVVDTQAIDTRQIDDTRLVRRSAFETSTGGGRVAPRECQSPAHSVVRVMKSSKTSPSSIMSSEERLSEITPLVPAEAKEVSMPTTVESSQLAVIPSDGHTRSKEIAFLCTAWAMNATCLAMAGGPAALACGPIANRLWLFGLIAFHLSFICWTGRRMLAKKRLATPDTLHLWWWVEPSKMAVYCCLSCMAGVAAGLLGIGGGLIKGPLLISIGLRPINAVATSNYMILYTSSTNVLAFLLAGRLDPSHSVIFAVLTLMGGIMGATTLKRFFTLGSRQHILTLILGCSIVLGGIAMATVNIREILLRARGHTSDVHEKTFAEACEYLEHETTAWKRMKLVDI